MIMRTIFASLLFVAITACGDDAPSTAPNGEACELGKDCTSEVCYLELVSEDFFGRQVYELTNGMCTDLCDNFIEGTLEEQWQGTCAEGELCLVYGSSDLICFIECVEDVTCREDYVCIEISHGKSACLPPADAARVVEESVKIMPAAELKATK